MSNLVWWLAKVKSLSSLCWFLLWLFTSLILILSCVLINIIMCYYQLNYDILWLPHVWWLTVAQSRRSLQTSWSAATTAASSTRTAPSLASHRRCSAACWTRPWRKAGSGNAPTQLDPWYLHWFNGNRWHGWKIMVYLRSFKVSFADVAIEHGDRVVHPL